jgi:CHAD domain-containing protein
MALSVLRPGAKKELYRPNGVLYANKMSPGSIAEVSKKAQSAGLDFWMNAVNRECNHVRQDFAPTPVHDLRVALRRCRSIADGFRTLDPHPAWKQMKDESKRLFQQLGALRDTQVMIEWAQRLAPVPDETYFILSGHLQQQEQQHRENAAAAVRDFNRKKWAAWARLLCSRTRNIPVESTVFQHLALECWSDVRAQHRQALRNRSHAAYHRVRLALKKFRYTVENFLPSRHEQWGQELRELQDLLGELHDLNVLWRTALTIKALPTKKAHREWHQRVLDESSQRLVRYREKMLGKASLLLAWRTELPDSDHLKDAALAKLRVWSIFRDPDAFHAEHVAKLALQIHDGLDSLHLLPTNGLPDRRRVLEAAALAHAVGFGKNPNKYHLASYRLLRKLTPPLGMSSATLRQIALVVRFHRGALPRLDQNALSGMTVHEKTSLMVLSGVLRLADAFDRLYRSRIDQLHMERSREILYLIAPGYSEHDASAEKLAAARHLLEIACGMAILIRSARPEDSASGFSI